MVELLHGVIVDATFFQFPNGAQSLTINAEMNGKGTGTFAVYVSATRIVNSTLL